MPSTLRSPVVASVLGRLHAQADDEDSLAAERVRAPEAAIDHRLAQDQRYHLLEPRLLPSGLVVADLSANDPDLLPYLEYVREPACGYFSMTVPLDDGVELSTREGDGRP